MSGISQRSPAALTAFGEDVSTLCTSHLAPSTFYTGKPYVAGLGHAFLFRNYRATLKANGCIVDAADLPPIEPRQDP